MDLHSSRSKEAEKAVASLEELARRNAKPGHHLARAVLLTIGQVLREGGPGAGIALIERARVAGRSAGPAWGDAVLTELTLACGEFAQGVDPRYLGLPNYDLQYTEAARRRLADRLEVARELGFELAPREAQLLELADRVLAQHLARRSAGVSGAGPGPTEVTPGDRSPDRGGLN